MPGMLSVSEQITYWMYKQKGCLIGKPDFFTSESIWFDVVSKSYGHDTINLIHENDCLKLFLVNKWPFARFLISLPGAFSSCSSNSRCHLIDQAIHLADARNLHFLSIKDAAHQIQDDRLLENNRYYHMVIDLKRPIADGMSGSAKRNLRHSYRHNYSICTSPKNMSDIYKVLICNYRRLASPLPPYSFFEDLYQAFGNRMQILALMLDKEVVGGSISFINGPHQYICWFSCLPKVFQKHANYRLVWQTLDRANAQGIRFINFGTSMLNSGNFKFKARWGALPEPRYSYYYSRYGRFRPDYLYEVERNPWLKRMRRIYAAMPTAALRLINPYFSSFEPISF